MYFKFNRQCLCNIPPDYYYAFTQDFPEHGMKLENIVSYESFLKANKVKAGKLCCNFPNKNRLAKVIDITNKRILGCLF